MSAQDHLTGDELLDLVLSLAESPVREASLNHLKSCPECSAALRSLVEARESASASVDDAMVRLGVLEPRAVPARGMSVRRRLWWIAGAAAAVAAIALIVLMPWPRANSRLTAELRRLPTDVEFTKVRSATTLDRDPHLLKGIRAYGQARDDRAVAELERARPAAEEEPVRRVYLGSALAFQGRYQQAVEWLSPLRESVIPDPWGAEARWTLCVALYGAGHRSAADSLLNVLSQVDEAGRNRARALGLAAARFKTRP